MPLAILTFLTGMAISAVAIYYSVLGLASIFSAAVMPIIIMGTILELSKLVTAWWLKSNWTRAPILLRSYMLTAVLVLMLITSMGIFGFLSKAHSDQSLVSGDVLSKVSLIDEKIKIERENIANAQSVIKQMDAAVNGVIATGDQEVKLRDGSTRVNSAAERSLQIRRSQAKDRANLTKQIEEAQNKIIKLQEEAAPIRAEMRKVEAEVGPIKYIAAFIYGDNPDANILERAVTWVIITIVFVFDPLAVLLLLASQMSFQWVREQQDAEEQTLYGWENEWTAPDPFVADVGEKPTEEEKAEIAKQEEPVPHHPDTHPYLRAGFGKGFENLEPMVYKPESKVEEPTQEAPNISVEAIVEYVPANSDAGSTPTYEIIPELQKELDKQEEPLFVQNEEQGQSDLWSKTITQTEYIERTEEKKKDALINHWADLVRSKKIAMADVPEYLLLEVRARV